jgi:glycosyltransferase involved in cell wall biosynthesis
LTIEASICICTRNRPEELGRALTSITQSSLAPRQVVVADDGDDDGVASFVAARELEITYVRGPRSGLGANRNAAIAAATGSHLLFLDDDAVLGGDFLAKMDRHLEQLPADRRGRSILTGVELNSGRSVQPNEQGLLGFQSRPYRSGERLRTVVINAALFPRPLFEQVRFDPSLTYGFDEVDVTTRAVARGFAIVPCFDAANRHFPSPVGRAQYGSAASAARLYVTLKRRRWTEGSPLRAWAGFALASGHLYLASIRRLGFSAGRGEAGRALGQAWSHYRSFVRSRASSGGSPA